MLLIFDMGNVVSRSVDVVPRIAERLGIGALQLLEFSRPHFEALTTGRESDAEYWRSFNERFGTDQREDLLVTLFQPQVDGRVRQLILDLKAEGHRVVCGTNTIEGHYLRHRSNGDYAAFDRVYPSHLVGAAKPDPAFLGHILREERRGPAEALFVDDDPANVDSARRQGIRSFLYRSFTALTAWLAEQLPSAPGGRISPVSSGPEERSR